MKRRPATPEGIEKMRKEDARSPWVGVFQCCGKKVQGTPAVIAELVDLHLKGGCDGKPNRANATAQSANR